MSKNQKILLGAFTLSPIIGMLLYVLTFLSMFMTIASFDPASNEMPTTFFGTFGVAVVILLLTILVTIVLTVYYIIHIINNKTLNTENNEPLIWILIILFAGFVGQIIYFYMKIWSETPTSDEEDPNI